MQKKEGYLGRIHSLSELKKKHRLISDLFKRQENKLSSEYFETIFKHAFNTIFIIKFQKIN